MNEDTTIGINIDDERLWQILFDEACVEGKQAERIYAELRKISKDSWISCEERLPERTFDEKMNDSYKQYLVFIDSIDGWNIDIAVHDLWSDKKWRETRDCCEIENVIAWRPLPEPCRPEKGDNNESEKKI